MRIPRKKKKQIPVGYYCYSPVEFPSEKTNWEYHIKSCPFYQHINGLEGHCCLLKAEIMDQVKDCGKRIPK